MGGRVVVLFTGDGLQHAGWVLAHSAASGRHHVLYDDGEVDAAEPSSNACLWQHRGVLTFTEMRLCIECLGSAASY